VTKVRALALFLPLAMAVAGLFGALHEFSYSVSPEYVMPLCFLALAIAVTLAFALAGFAARFVQAKDVYIKNYHGWYLRGLITPWCKSTPNHAFIELFLPIPSVQCF
jgi:hypothetical protein